MDVDRLSPGVAPLRLRAIRSLTCFGRTWPESSPLLEEDAHDVKALDENTDDVHAPTSTRASVEAIIEPHRGGDLRAPVTRKASGQSRPRSRSSSVAPCQLSGAAMRSRISGPRCQRRQAARTQGLPDFSRKDQVTRLTDTISWKVSVKVGGDGLEPTTSSV